MRDKASCQTLKPPRSSSYRKLGLLGEQEEQARRGKEEGRERRSEDEGLCKGGKRVFAYVCVRVCVVLSSLLMTAKSLSEPRGILHIPQASLL